jgi:hypothetical protein
MKRERGRGVEPGRPHSEKAGEAALKSGERVTLYRALRGLTCSRCGGPIREGETFTREAAREGGPPLVRRCRRCVPFTPHGLLDALFTNEGAREPAPPPASADVREKVRSRLGPALAARRKDRGGSDSES